MQLLLQPHLGTELRQQLFSASGTPPISDLSYPKTVAQQMTPTQGHYQQTHLKDTKRADWP